MSINDARMGIVLALADTSASDEEFEIWMDIYDAMECDRYADVMTSWEEATITFWNDPSGRIRFRTGFFQ